MHEFHEVAQRSNKTDTERAILQAIIWLSVSPGFTGMTFEEIFDHLAATYKAESESPRLAASDM